MAKIDKKCVTMADLMCNVDNGIASILAPRHCVACLVMFVHILLHTYVEVGTGDCHVN